VTIETLVQDDTRPNPDVAKRLAQELVVRDKVDFLAGVIFTPDALAIAPLTAEAKVPFVIMNAGTSIITTRPPYLVRVSFTLWQSCYPLGQWAATTFKTAYTLSAISDRAMTPRRLSKGFKDGGGTIVDSVRVPLVNPDFATYMQRVKDARPAGRQR
jgi:branched-chain amino acid transport system substrate-binding protein